VLKTTFIEQLVLKFVEIYTFKSKT
jgi:hypothetical protein